jgi:hypothetical protein
MKNKETLFESIDDEKIILNEAGKFPRRVIMKTLEGDINEYRLVKTKFRKLTLNK